MKPNPDYKPAPYEYSFFAVPWYELKTKRQWRRLRGKAKAQRKEWTLNPDYTLTSHHTWLIGFEPMPEEL